MSNYQYETTWKVLREYNFDISEIECRELICVLCKKLLIEANEAPCACKFCASCIEEYISNGNTICPGNTNECREEILLLGVNVNNHSVTNRKISKLKLKCPSNGCSYEDILSNMDHHLMLCGRQSTVCPYLQMGCSKIAADKNEITNHLQMESYEHAQMVKEMFSILKNEIEYLTKEIQILKPDSDKQQVRIENLSDIIEDAMPTLGDCSNNQENNLIIPPAVINVESDSTVGKKIENELTNCSEFYWQILNFSLIKNKKQQIESNIFLTHRKGYNIQLKLVNDAWAYGILLYPNCVEGCFDQFLQWPVEIEFTVSITNKKIGYSLKPAIRKYYTPYKSRIQPFYMTLSADFLLENDCLEIKCITKIINAVKIGVQL